MEIVHVNMTLSCSVYLNGYMYMEQTNKHARFRVMLTSLYPPPPNRKKYTRGVHVADYVYQNPD